MRKALLLSLPLLFIFFLTGCNPVTVSKVVGGITYQVKIEAFEKEMKTQISLWSKIDQGSPAQWNVVKTILWSEDVFPYKISIQMNDFSEATLTFGWLIKDDKGKVKFTEKDPSAP